MRDDSLADFGLLIAFLLPGLTVLLGAAPLTNLPHEWLFGSGTAAPTIGGFLYGTVASVLAGLTASTIRWVVIDTLHHHTGLPPPRWNFARLVARSGAFELLIQAHYRYYQFYANMVVALTFVLAARKSAAPASPDGVDAAMVALIGLFFAGSRDTLRKYYGRVEQLLGNRPRGGTARRPPAKA
ncbi:MAG: hypothetical protein J0M17_24550 [Planctomycetes bacterium]|nr:hypothetical protein [Planctomycetota bacterium]